MGMMSARTMMQEALFYEFGLERYVRPTTRFDRSTGSWTCPAIARICGQLTGLIAGFRREPKTLELL
jgi:hypothetical protein